MFGDDKMSEKEIKKHIKNGDWVCISNNNSCFFNRMIDITLRKGQLYLTYKRKGRYFYLVNEYKGKRRLSI